MCAISDEIREEVIRETLSRMLSKFSPEDIIDLGYDRDFVMDIANCR